MVIVLKGYYAAARIRLIYRNMGKSKKYSVDSHPLGWLELKSQIVTSVDVGVEESEPLYIAGGNAK